MNKKLVYILIGIIIICLIMISLRFIVPDLFLRKESKEAANESLANPSYVDNDFSFNIVKAFNKNENSNYLISPYSIEIALSMLRDGAKGESKSQIEKVIGSRKINNVSIQKRVNVANAAFIKNDFKNNVKDSYNKNLVTNYNAKLIYDDFNTPEAMNDWAKKETYGMIEKIASEVPNDFKIGIANAVAIDVDWKHQFECLQTSNKKFTKLNGEKIEVSMMHEEYMGSDSNKYFKNEEEEGVILPYLKYDKNGNSEYDNEKADNQLEFIGIIPKDNVKEYVNNFSKTKLDNIEKTLKSASKETHLDLSLPMFSYDYDSGDKFGKALESLGIKDVFDSSKADLSEMIEPSVAVSDSIHKTYIDLNEKGTKAAAVTGFMIPGTAKPEKKPEIVYINFNKPFVYMIRDIKTKELLFFGVVYEPNKWEGDTCSNDSP